jgi:hypothetical protein
LIDFPHCSVDGFEEKDYKPCKPGVSAIDLDVTPILPRGSTVPGLQYGSPGLQALQPI